VRVRGELASLTRAASGTWYSALEDRAAQDGAVMSAPRNVLVDFAPREGDELELVANVGLYEARGEFQLGVESMRPGRSGAAVRAVPAAEERLPAEGLFDEAVKRPIPRVPARIGSLTSLCRRLRCTTS